MHQDYLTSPCSGTEVSPTAWASPNCSSLAQLPPTQIQNPVPWVGLSYQLGWGQFYSHPHWKAPSETLDKSLKPRTWSQRGGVGGAPLLVSGGECTRAGGEKLNIRPLAVRCTGAATFGSH